MRSLGKKAEIFIRVDAIAAGCGGGSKVSTHVADSKLSQVLAHEFGHAIEHYLMEGRPDTDRMIREGFASWFEQYGAKYLSLVDANEVQKFYRKLAQYRLSKGTFTFMGTAQDYALASMYFHALIDSIIFYRRFKHD